MPTIDKPLQFGIRHLLGAMFVVAVLSALIAPWVRAWSAGQWLGLGVQTILEVVTFAACLRVHLWLRSASFNRLGEVQFRVPVRIEGSDMWNPANAFVLVGVATIMLGVLTASLIQANGRLETFSLYGIFAGFFAALGVTQLWHPPREVLVGDHGVALIGRFLSWDQLWFADRPGSGSAPLLLKTTGWAFELFPDAKTEQPLAEYLQRRARPWPNPPQRRKKTLLHKQ